MVSVIEEAQRKGLAWGRPDGVIVPRAAVIAEARSWIETPFHHQADLKGKGVDCGGLVRGVSVVLGLIPADYRKRLPAVIQGYARTAKGPLGMQLCEHYWQRIDPADATFGDVLLFRWDAGPPQHSAFLAPYIGAPDRFSLVHALLPARRVVENLYDDTWRRRLVAAFHLPGVER